jgi:hypothetical protein
MLSQDKVASDVEMEGSVQISGMKLMLTQSIFYEHLTFWHRNSFANPNLNNSLHTPQPEMAILKYIILITVDSDKDAGEYIVRTVSRRH